MQAETGTTSLWTERGTTVRGTEAAADGPRASARVGVADADQPAPPEPRRGQAEWTVRKTMRTPSNPNGHRHGGDAAADRRRWRRTSTGRGEPISSARQPVAEMMARGAARIAFARHEAVAAAAAAVSASQQGSGGEPRRVPTSEPDRGSDRRVNRTAGKRAKPAAKPAASEAESAAGPRQETSEQGEEANNEVQNTTTDEMAEGVDTTDTGSTTADLGQLEVEQWLLKVVVMLARVAAAYWQVVSPVFDVESELRQRLESGEPTRGDAVVCVLAVVFLFLVASASVWTVRGVMWFVGLVREVGRVLGAVAGL
ncbi:hypothetical protein VTJ49DRAFT_769 [Mycothermus thermophilus]|uniref:Uncharacterized protein n=1 Tax=Humicola insolens TaxID=85995 RepID=A0ABR3VFT5_HUMIN